MGGSFVCRVYFCKFGRVRVGGGGYLIPRDVAIVARVQALNVLTTGQPIARYTISISIAIVECVILQICFWVHFMGSNAYIIIMVSQS